MRFETQTIRIGENMGPVDWDHPMARDMPPIWREAEQNPDAFTFTDYRRTILSICMYDGWPYWTPTPAIQFIGPIGPEWAFFNSYGVDPYSIERRDRDASLAEDAQRLSPEGVAARAGTASPKLPLSH